MHGAKYISKRYSGGIIGDISLVSGTGVVLTKIVYVYVVKNELSMQTILNPNIEFITHRLRKGNESKPLNAESFGRNWIGPERKNLLIPKDEANKLKRKVRSGRAALKVSNVVIVKPSASFGKNPSMANSIDKDMLTYNDIMI